MLAEISHMSDTEKRDPALREEIRADIAKACTYLEQLRHDKYRGEYDARKILPNNHPVYIPGTESYDKRLSNNIAKFRENIINPLKNICRKLSLLGIITESDENQYVSRINSLYSSITSALHHNNPYVLFDGQGYIIRDISKIVTNIMGIHEAYPNKPKSAPGMKLT